MYSFLYVLALQYKARLTIHIACIMCLVRVLMCSTLQFTDLVFDIKSSFSLVFTWNQGAFRYLEDISERRH